MYTILGGHGTHRHLAALADDDFDDEEKVAMQPMSIEDGTSQPKECNGVAAKDKKGKKDQVKKDSAGSQGRCLFQFQLALNFLCPLTCTCREG